MNGYVFFFENKRIELTADSMYAAKLKAIEQFKPRKSQQHMVHGGLAEVAGVPVMHTASN